MFCKEYQYREKCERALFRNIQNGRIPTIYALLYIKSDFVFDNSYLKKKFFKEEPLQISKKQINCLENYKNKNKKPFFFLKIFQTQCSLLYLLTLEQLVALRILLIFEQIFEDQDLKICPSYTNLIFNFKQHQIKILFILYQVLKIQQRQVKRQSLVVIQIEIRI